MTASAPVVILCSMVVMTLIRLNIIFPYQRDHHGADNDHYQHPPERDATQDPLRQGHRHVPDGLLRHGLPGPARVRLCQLHLLWKGPSNAKEASGEGREGQQWEGSQVRRCEGELGIVDWTFLTSHLDWRKWSVVKWVEDWIKKYINKWIAQYV